MNILFLCDEYPPGPHGGIGTAVRLLAKALVNQGHKVVVAGNYEWGYGGADFFDDEGVAVYRFRRSLDAFIPGRDKPLFKKVISKLLKVAGLLQWDAIKSLKEYQSFVESLIAKHQIDVIEMADFNDYIRFVDKYVRPIKWSVPTIVKIHGSLTYLRSSANLPIPEHWKKMEYEILCNAAMVTSVSSYAKNKISGGIGFKGAVTVLYNGIDTTQAPEKNYENDRKVLFTGTLSLNKGVFQLARAWNIVNEKMPDGELILLGKGPVDEVKQYLSPSALGSVHFKGHVDRKELFQELSSAAVAIFPSFAECFALAPMEAMSCKTAVIYTSRTSGPELIDDGVDGLLVDPDNVTQIADSILSLLQDKSRRMSIAARGQEKVFNFFSIEQIAKNHVELYCSVIQKKDFQTLKTNA